MSKTEKPDNMMIFYNGCELKYIIHVKNLAQCLVENKHSINNYYDDVTM